MYLCSYYVGVYRHMYIFIYFPLQPASLLQVHPTREGQSEGNRAGKKCPCSTEGGVGSSGYVTTVNQRGSRTTNPYTVRVTQFTQPKVGVHQGQCTTLGPQAVCN